MASYLAYALVCRPATSQALQAGPSHARLHPETKAFDKLRTNGAKAICKARPNGCGAPTPSATYPVPVRRARERMVGPPLDMRLVCMGWPLPQLGMANRRKSLPTASTFMK